MLNRAGAPDYFDLNDWIVTHHPEVFAASKYLHVESQVQLWIGIWINAGKPSIQEISQC